MNIKEQLEKLKSSQTIVMKQFIQNQNEASILDFEIQKICQKELGDGFGVTILASLTGGFASEEWDPKVFIYPFQKDGRSFVKIDGNWAWYDEGHIYMDVYSHKILDSKDFPFDPEQLEKECERLEEELGLKFRIIQYKTKKIEQPRNSDDLLEKYPGGEILASGELWSFGWDIPDHWAILELDDGKHIFYSTNGHGIGYDNHIEPGQDTEGFTQFLLGNLGHAPVSSDELATIDEILSAQK